MAKKNAKSRFFIGNIAWNKYQWQQPMRPHNILILCPNHHKEFDKGDRKIIEHTNDKIIFELNKKKYQIDLA